MIAQQSIQAIFLDIGGVLLTNGWDQQARQRGSQQFGLDFNVLNERHHRIFDTYESGKMTLDEYLTRIVFYEPRDFSRETFTQFILDQSEPHTAMIDLFRRLKKQYGLKLFAVNNEGRELNAYRIEHFGLKELFDAFMSSCYVHVRKPDPEIFRIALDISQIDPAQVIYFDDRQMFVEVAQSVGIQAFQHLDYESTCQKLATLGFSITED
ncbi:HAD family hydrolase [Spirosoma endophyticum]|uniref:Putative hydrolase of the HAD superfamily n=1 Tax=Spirosoma endophyticum TaxID=662367 RepID=A0A1I1SRT8_9BACT|nr:HAD family phosphatase [Spirosoma endophyticum]SFD45790.1 putative hydrolase of the HAD superfamily [Spirosoma endophyticum]